MPVINSSTSSVEGEGLATEKPGAGTSRRQSRGPEASGRIQWKTPAEGGRARRQKGLLRIPIPKT